MSSGSCTSIRPACSQCVGELCVHCAGKKSAIIAISNLMTNNTGVSPACISQMEGQGRRCRGRRGWDLEVGVILSGGESGKEEAKPLRGRVVSFITKWRIFVHSLLIFGKI